MLFAPVRNEVEWNAQRTRLVGLELPEQPLNVRYRPVADIPHVRQSARMTTARAFLIATLQRVADGGDVGEAELDTAVPDPFAPDHAEKSAWEELSHWADDADIRQRDERYAASKRKRMRDRVAALMENGS